MTYHIALGIKRPTYPEVDPSQLCLPTLKAFFGNAAKQKISLRRRAVPVGHTNTLTDLQLVEAAGKKTEAARELEAPPVYARGAAMRLLQLASWP